VLYKRYEAEAWWWELTNLARKLVMSLARQVLSNPLEQLVVVLLTILTHLYMVVYWKPYDRSSLDMMESGCSLFNVFFLFSGFMYLSGLLTTGEKSTLTYLLQLTMVLSYSLVVMFVCLDFFPVFSAVVWEYWIQFKVVVLKV
jgi:hypothetical protein